MKIRNILSLLVVALTLAACGRQITPSEEGSVSALARRPQPGATCDGSVKSSESIQAEINACSEGATITVQPGVYRETIAPKSGQILLGRSDTGRATIKGSDIVTGWKREVVGAETYWSIAYTAKSETAGRGYDKCQSGTSSTCLLRDQVYIADSTGTRPLGQVTSLGSVGENSFFAGNRKLYIKRDTATLSAVEVTMRDRWIDGTSGPSRVTIDGFVMAHASNPSQSGAVQANGPEWTITNNDLSYAHGAGLSTYSDRAVVTGNVVHHNGQLGMHGGAVGMRIESNTIHDNNTERFNAFWEAGGTKWTRVTDLRVINNQSYGNDGPGLWCDIDCNTVVFSGNTVHDNTRQGIHYEISANAEITNNLVYRNGFLTDNYELWPEGAGILVQNSSNVTVANNRVLYNADGVGVIQSGLNVVKGVLVKDNTVIVEHSRKGYYLERYGKAALSSELIAFVTDSEKTGSTDLFDPANGNRAFANHYNFKGSESERWVAGATRVDTANPAGPEAAVAEWNAAAPTWWSEGGGAEAAYLADTTAYAKYGTTPSEL
jgi:parallel beta-helix repeat protein